MVSAVIRFMWINIVCGCGIKIGLEGLWKQRENWKQLGLCWRVNHRPLAYWTWNANRNTNLGPCVSIDATADSKWGTWWVPIWEHAVTSSIIHWRACIRSNPRSFLTRAAERNLEQVTCNKVYNGSLASGRINGVAILKYPKLLKYFKQMQFYLFKVRFVPNFYLYVPNYYLNAIA